MELIISREKAGMYTAGQKCTVRDGDGRLMFDGIVSAVDTLPDGSQRVTAECEATVFVPDELLTQAEAEGLSSELLERYVLKFDAPIAAPER